MMLALTLWPEWAACVAIPDIGKDIENRGWPPPRRVVGQRIAIHAGAHIGGRRAAAAVEDAAEAIERTSRLAGSPVQLAIPMFVRQRPRSVSRGIDWSRQFGLVREDGTGWSITTSAIVATAVIGEPTRDSPSGWAVPGEWHWSLLDVQVLAGPVACRGAQGLWPVPADVALRLAA